MMKTRQSGPAPARARTFILCALTALALLGAVPIAPAVAQPAAVAAAALTWQHRGFTIASYAENDLYDSGPALQQLADAGANSVTFAVTWYTPHQYSTDIYRTGSTATDGALIWAVERAKSLGLRVILKPHLDSQDGAWRAFINPGDADRWFANYAAMLDGYADLGRLHGAEGLCVGAELIAMSTNPAHDARWRALIAGVRGRFAGTLSYSANWGGEGFAEEYPKVPFWDALDVLGISAYFELADTNAPTVAQLRARWDGWRTNKIAPFQARWNKPLMFIEGGYRSVDGAARQPWNFDAPGGADRQEQADLYEALFQTWATVPWFYGSAFWYWGPNVNVDAAGTGYEVQNKTALITVAAWFKGSGATPSPAPAGQLTVVGPLALDRTVVGPGQTLTGRITYRNAGTAPVGVGEIVITARPPGGTNAGGPYIDFSPRQGAATIAPGAEIVVTASRQFAASDPNGAWYAFATYRDTAGVYRDAPGQQQFAVSATPPPTPTTAPPPPPPPTPTTAPPPPPTPTPTTTPPPTPTIAAPTPTSVPAACPVGQFRAEYFPNRTLGGTPTFARCEGAINNDWGSGGPGNGIPVDGFSVRWIGRFSFTAGSHTFTARADDGVRLLVDGTSLIDAWRDQGPTTFEATQSLTAGEHEVRVEYYENTGGATAQVSWRAATVPPTPTAIPPTPTAAPPTATAVPGGCPTGQYTAEYFPNRTLTGTPATRRCETSIGYEWSGAPSVAGIGADNFSVRWNGRFSFAAGAYTFTARADDGIRVFLDGTPLLDEWRDQGPTTYTATRTLTGGEHELRVEYYENSGGAVAQFGWQPAAAAPPTNLALGKSATADSACAPGEGADKAVDGSTANNSKWCSTGVGKSWRVDLGASATVSRFVVKHAGAGGEQVAWNTRDFIIQVSVDGVNWTTAVTVNGNTASETTHPIADTAARYVRVGIAVPTSDGNAAARLYEVEVWGR